MMNSISESTILAFLADRNVSELAFFFNGWNHCLLRSYYDDETDFIYMLSGYRDTHELNEKAKLAGIYSHIHKALFAPCYDLARILPTEDISLQQIAHRLESLATERVILKVDGQAGFPKLTRARLPVMTRITISSTGLKKKPDTAFIIGQPRFLILL